MPIDSSAWIELYEGSEAGRAVKAALMQNACYTSMVTVAEVTSAAMRKSKDSMALVEVIGGSSSLLGIDPAIASLAGRLNFERKRSNRKWGMTDSFILEAGMIYGLKILTEDRDFGDLPNVVLV